jgi:hypothetical protein
MTDDQKIREAFDTWCEDRGKDPEAPCLAAIPLEVFQAGAAWQAAQPVQTDAPIINMFRIQRIGGENITAEGNQWFCHAHEVKAYKQWVRNNLRTTQYLADVDDAN